MYINKLRKDKIPKDFFVLVAYSCCWTLALASIRLKRKQVYLLFAVFAMSTYYVHMLAPSQRMISSRWASLA
jgi:hypothetical protein